MKQDKFFPGLYLHIPFCARKCPYCDFYSTTDRSLIPRWLQGIKTEAVMYRDSFPAFDTLYLGGGSPSLLPADVLEEAITFLRKTFFFVPETEITLEANPQELNTPLLDGLRRIGINRISLGVQSFQDENLHLLRRLHTPADVFKVVEHIRGGGGIELGLDLIYGLPGQTVAQWRDDLEQAVALQPEHLSCYQLTYSRGTLFWGLKEKGRLTPLTEEEEARLFLFTSRFLGDRGYIHYEISNFAREDRYRSRHNQKYWRRLPYLGLGPSAHSFLGNRRWWNVRSLLGYCRAVEERRYPLEGEEVLDEEQIRLERMGLGMRTLEGIALDDLADATIFSPKVEALIRNRLCKIVDGRLIPTVRGYLLADRLPLYL